MGGDKELTQEIVDKYYMDVKRFWNEKLKDSGKSKVVFMATDKTATDLLYHHDLAQKKVRALGFKLPDLVDGVTITECDPSE